MFYDVLEKKSYYNKAQAHFLGGAKQRESLEGKSQKFIDQLKQGLPENIQNSIQGAYDRGKPIPPRQRNKIDEHIRQVASTQNRGQRTNVNTKGGKRIFIGPSGQGFADRGMYTGELYNRPNMGSQIVQEDVPRARSGRRGVSSVTGHSSKRSPSGDKIQLRDIEIQRARDERAALKKQRKLKVIERKKALDAASLKEQSTSDAIANFAAEKAQRNVRPEVVKQTKSNKAKVPRKLKKKLKKELAQQAITDTPIAPNVLGTDVADKAKSGFKPTMKNNPNLIDNPNLKITPAERFTENLKKPTSKVTPPPMPQTSKVPAKSSPRVSSDYPSGHYSPRAKSTASDTLDKAKSSADSWKSNRKRNIGLGLGAATVIGAGLAYRRYKKNQEQKRRASMKKVAYNNYYNDYLSPKKEKIMFYDVLMEKQASRKVMRAMREANKAQFNQLYDYDGNLQISKRARKILAGRGISERVGSMFGPIENMQAAIGDSMYEQADNVRSLKATKKLDALYERLKETGSSKKVRDYARKKSYHRKLNAQQTPLRRGREYQKEIMEYFDRDLPPYSPPKYSSSSSRSSKTVSPLLLAR